MALHTLSRVINGHAGISPEMALRFEKMGWGTAESWVRLQTAYDLAQARKDVAEIEIRPLQAVGA